MRSATWHRAAQAALLVLVLAVAGGVRAQSARRVYLPTVVQLRPTPTPTPTATPTPVPQQPTGELRAVWVSRFDWTRYGQWPTAGDVQAIVDDAVRGGFNAIIFQVRAAGDAYYTPGLEPWAARLTGTVSASTGQHPGWDPLAELLHRAHAAGLQVHAWINVYPAYQAPADGTGEPLAPPYGIWPPAPFWRFSWSDAGQGEGSGCGLGYTWRVYDIHGYMPVVAGAYLWASPACPEWQQHVAAVAEDIVRRYPVDGLHLDNVRYPGRQYSLDPFLVAACESDPACQSVHDDAWRGAYQRAQVTNLVRRITDQTHAIRPGTVVSAAVMPIYINHWGWPNTYEGYYDYYQDSQAWLRNRDVDVVIPMLYTNVVVNDLGRWTIALQDWRANAGAGTLVAGIGVSYSSGCVPQDQVLARIDAARAVGASGQALFSLSGLRDCGLLDMLRSGPYAGG